MNSLSIVGRTGRDPEIKYFENGNIVGSTTMAVRRRLKGQDVTDWFFVEAWGKTAEILNDYVKKGDLLAVNGSIVSDTYTNKEGVKQTKWTVKVRELTLLEKKSTSGKNEKVSNESADYGGAEMF